jgi:hypothetical protein
MLINGLFSARLHTICHDHQVFHRLWSITNNSHGMEHFTTFIFECGNWIKGPLESIVILTEEQLQGCNYTEKTSFIRV